MIRYDFEQGSAAWIAMHLDRPTASAFDRILTPKTRKLSASSRGYAMELCASWLLGAPVNEFSSAFMLRGKSLEDEARNWFAFTNDTEVETVGFLTTDDGRVGCSPDFLIPGKAEGGEIKCLSAVNHVSALLQSADEYTLQVQGNLWVAECDVWHRVYYNPHPSLPPVVQRVERDEGLIGQLSGAVLEFCDSLDEMKAILLGVGCKPIPPPKPGAPPTDDRLTEAELSELDREFFGPLPTPDFSRTEDRILQAATGPLSRPELAAFAPLGFQGST